MSSSFITKDNVHGFWVSDALMQVVCWGIVNAIDSEPFHNNNSWLKRELREHIYDNSQGIFIGFMNLRLDEFLVSQEHKNEFIKIISKAKMFFQSNGEYIPLNHLNNFQLISATRREWVSPLETIRLVKVLIYLEKVVNEKITSKDSDDIEYDF